MWIRTTKSLLGVVALLSLLSACKVDVPNTTVTVNHEGATTLTCSAMLSPSAGSSVVSGVPSPITVNAKDGVAPYQIVDAAIAFDKETVISRTYENLGSVNKTVVDTVVVKDASGHVTQCNFLITVNPVGSPSDLACNLVSTPASPVLNQSTGFVATALHGQAPYSFSEFNPGTNGVVLSPLAMTSSTQASASAKYPVSGLQTASVKVTDNSGTHVVCSTLVNVAVAPSVSLVASPASSVVAGSDITLTATPSGFSATPSYVFSTTRSGVTLSWVGNIATVKSTAIQSAFDVVVTATAGTQVATHTISLSFTNQTSLACSVSHSSGIYYPGDTVSFNVSATSGEALQITSFTVPSDATLVASTSTSRSVSFSLSGDKTVLVKARSVASGALCQSGSDMSDSVTISPITTPALTCTGYTSINPSYRFQWFNAYAVLSGGVGLKWVDTISITKNGINYYNYNGVWLDATSARLEIENSGTYLINFNLRDSNGNTGSCSTTQIVWY